MKIQLLGWLGEEVRVEMVAGLATGVARAWEERRMVMRVSVEVGECILSVRILLRKVEKRFRDRRC